MDRVLSAAARPRAAISEAVRTLRPGGRLLIVEDFEAIEVRAPDNALAELRRWLGGAGLDAARLRPCDLLDRHLIVALAHRPALLPVAAARADSAIPPLELRQ
jgi:SAM-dependent methyltransferase